MGLGFYQVALSGGNGALADKAEAFLTAEGWAGYLGLVDQIAAVAVLLGAGVVVAWVFGREHIDRTFPALFATGVARGTIAAAKFVVMALWVIGLSLVICLFALALGIVGGVGAIGDDLTSHLVRLLVVVLGAGMLALTLGWVASVGRGYLPAIGVLILIIAAAQVAVLFGTGAWFPYALPGLIAVSGMEGVPSLGPQHLALIPAVTLLAIWLTVRWWRHAEVS
jgi:ABC-2 type transport system permease protein